MKVTATASQNAAFIDTRSRYEKEVATEREKVPKAVLWREIDTKALGGGVPVFGDIRGSGETELLLLQDALNGEGAPRIRAVSLEGKQVWEMEYTELKTVAPKRTVIQDIDGDGVNELVSAGGKPAVDRGWDDGDVEGGGAPARTRAVSGAPRPAPDR